MNRLYRIISFFFVLLFTSLLSSCWHIELIKYINELAHPNKQTKESVRNTPPEKVIVNTPIEKGTIGSMDIPASDFFWILRPWKQGTIVTMDRKARFSEITFSGDSGYEVTPLVDFPQGGGRLIAAPEGDLCIANHNSMFYIADTANKKTKEYMPIWGSRLDEHIPTILDPENQIILFDYSPLGDYSRQPCFNIIYDMKNDMELYKSPDGGESLSMYLPITQEIVLAVEYLTKDRQQKEYYFYNWKTKEIIRNDLTRLFTDYGSAGSLDKYRNINLKDRYMFYKEYPGYKTIKISWDENYNNIKSIPMDYLIPKGKHFDDIVFSPDYKWAKTLVGWYDGLNNDSLYKSIFFHLDDRYPNGISIPIFTEDYDKSSSSGRGTFVEHPVHGMCYAEDIWSKETGKSKQYLRLYKMSDVLEEINRQLMPEIPAKYSSSRFDDIRLNLNENGPGITDIKWLDKEDSETEEAVFGTAVKLSVRTKGIVDGEKITFKLFLEDADTEEPVKILGAAVNGDKAEVLLDFETLQGPYPIDEALFRYYKKQGNYIPREAFETFLPDYDEDVKSSMKMKPEYFFIASAEGHEDVISKFIEVSKTLKITYEDMWGKPVKGVKITVKESDGTEHEAFTDEDGIVVFTGLIPTANHMKYEEPEKTE